MNPNSVRYLACDGETSLGVAVKRDVVGSGGRERGGKMQPFVWNVLQPKQNKQHLNYNTGSPKVGPAKHFETNPSVQNHPVSGGSPEKAQQKGKDSRKDSIGLCFRRLCLANVKTVKVYRELVGTG